MTSASFSSVTLVGRLGSRVEQRELPSGDAVTTFTIIVDRQPRAGGRASVDAIACQTFRATVARRLAALEAGTPVRAEGHLRRRFWATPQGQASATDVEVRTLARVRP